MIPDVGAVCLFTFTTRFAVLDGVYRIRAETTFQDALAGGINFVDNLYTPAGLSESDFNTDYTSYLIDRIVVLESVVNSEVVYYVPESVFLNVPDPTIQEYISLILVTNLGVHKNTQVIYPLIDQIKDLIQANLGTTDPLRIVTNPQNKVYLTESQYALLEQARAANIDKLIPLSVQLKNEQAKNIMLAAENASLRSFIIQQAETS